MACCKEYICVKEGITKDAAMDIQAALYVKQYSNVEVIQNKDGTYDVHMLPGTRNNLVDLIEDVIMDGFFDASLVVSTI